MCETCTGRDGLRDLLALAWIEGLTAKSPAPPLPTRVRLDDTGRPSVVPLRPAGGDRG